MSKKEKIIDTVEIIGKTAISAIPFVGTFATEVYDTVKENCLAKRQEEWKQILEERLIAVECSIEEIKSHELFATSLIKATELAIKTSLIEKKKHLANAVANSLEANLDEDKLLLFFDLLDKYTISHIKIILFFNNPSKFEEVKNDSHIMGSPTILLFKVFPELENDFFPKLYKDLYLDGIVNTENINTSMTSSGMSAKRTSNFGDEFLKFILEKETE